MFPTQPKRGLQRSRQILFGIFRLYIVYLINQTGWQEHNGSVMIKSKRRMYTGEVAPWMTRAVQVPEIHQFQKRSRKRRKYSVCKTYPVRRRLIFDKFRQLALESSFLSYSTYKGREEGKMKERKRGHHFLAKLGFSFNLEGNWFRRVLTLFRRHHFSSTTAADYGSYRVSYALRPHNVINRDNK